MLNTPPPRTSTLPITISSVKPIRKCLTPGATPSPNFTPCQSGFEVLVQTTARGPVLPAPSVTFFSFPSSHCVNPGGSSSEVLMGSKFAGSAPSARRASSRAVQMRKRCFIRVSFAVHGKRLREFRQCLLRERRPGNVSPPITNLNLFYNFEVRGCVLIYDPDDDSWKNFRAEPDQSNPGSSPFGLPLPTPRAGSDDLLLVSKRIPHPAASPDRD